MTESQRDLSPSPGGVPVDGSFDGYFLEVADEVTGSVLWTASGEAYSVEALKAVARGVPDFLSSHPTGTARLRVFSTARGTETVVDVSRLARHTQEPPPPGKFPFSVIAK